MYANKISTSIDIYQLLKGKLVFTQALLSDFDLHLSQKTKGAPLNIQFIIDAFQNKEKKSQGNVQIQLNSINIQKGKFRYDIEDTPNNISKFNPNHICVEDFIAKLSLKSLVKDSLNIQIKRLSLKEQSGLTISNLVGRLISKESSYSIKDFELLLPDSKLEFNKLDFIVNNKKDSVGAITNFNFDLRKSYITPSDLKAFIPSLDRLKEKIAITTIINGRDDEITMTNLNIDFEKKLKLEANAKVKNWYSEDTYIEAKINKFLFSGNEIEYIANGFSNKTISLPQGINDLQNISFQGQLSGLLNKLTATGTLFTDNGILKTNLKLGFDKKDMYFTSIQGEIETKEFDLGKTINNNNLKNISFNLLLDIQKKHNNLSATVDGNINNLYFKGYTYNSIKLNLQHIDNLTNLDLSLLDEYADFELNVALDNKNKNNPILDSKINIHNLEISKTNLFPRWKNSNIALNLDLHLEGKNYNKLEGFLKIDSISLYRDNQELFINKFHVTAHNINKELSEIKINSDLLSGYIKGDYNFQTLVYDVKNVIYQYLPDLVPNNKNKQKGNNIFDFQIDIYNSERISQVLGLPFVVLQESQIKGKFDKSSNDFEFTLNSPKLFAGNNYFKSSNINLNTAQNKINLNFNSTFVNKNKVTSSIKILSTAQNNIINTNINYDNDHKNKVNSTFNINTEFEYNKPNKYLTTKLNLLDSQLKMNNEDWTLDKSQITISPQGINVEGFNLHTKDYLQSLSINGEYSSKNALSQLIINLKAINMEYLFETLAIDALQFGGYASGILSLSSLQGKPYATTNLNIKNFQFNKTELGVLELSSHLEQENNQIIIDGTIINKEAKRTFINGVIDPINQKLSINFDADSIDIGFLNKYTQSILNNVSGRGSGKVQLHGDFSNVTVSGEANIIDGKLGIKLLDAEYKFSDKIYLKDDLIYFNDIKFYDKMGNLATGSGKVSHDHFKNMIYYIGLKTNNFLVYNASEITNPIFYGVVYGKGMAEIHGDEQEINIDVKMETEKGTQVNMNFMDEKVTNYSFVKFKEKKQEQNEDDEIFSKRSLMTPIQTNSEMSVNMDFLISTTPEASFNLIMDPQGGDALKGNGYGDLQFKWNTKNEPELFGIYHVLKGNYNFKFQRLLEKNFKIKEGSSIEFRGDPFKAVLDVSAIYELYASLSDLDNSLVKTTGKTNVLTNCILNITGQLQKPQIKLDIGFPKESENIQAQIKSYMNTVDMISKQVTYLLILSKFYTPETSTVDNPSSNWTVMASATLSSQLTNIINQIDRRVQLGTHIRMSDTELTNTEVELLLSSQLLNDRLLINGNFGYRNNPTIQRDAVITDIDLEFLLNKRGTWRLKAYNHYNEKFFYLNSDKGVQTQGVGIIYRRNFDNLFELFKGAGKKKTKNKKQIHHPEPKDMNSSNKESKNDNIE